MARRNIDGSWGESRPRSIRFSRDDRRRLTFLRERWADATSDAELVRRALCVAVRDARATLAAEDADGEA
jgi:hypothetical protein